MSNVVPLQQLAPAMESHLRLLTPSWPIDAYSTLVPLDALPALQRDIEARLRPAKRSEVNACVATLMGTTNIGPGIKDPETYGKAMAEDLTEAGYPADVLKEAVKQVRRDPGWFSSPAMFEACERLVEPWRKRLRGIAQMEAEYARRQQEAAERAAEVKRKAQWEAEAEARRQAKVRWLRNVGEQARERLGDAAPLAVDIELADALIGRLYRGGKPVSWLDALAQGEQWAAKCCRQMALAERVRRALEQGRISWDEGLATTKRIPTDEESARRQIANMHDRPPRYVGGPPLESFWRALWRILRACECDTAVLPEEAAAAAVNNLKHPTGLAALEDTRKILDRQVAEEWEARRPKRATEES
jgi:hypothetical protein